MKTAVLLKSFIAVAMMYLLLLLSGSDSVAWFMKPLLLPFLMAAVAASTKFATKNLLLLALLFSWLGDIVLMFADQGALYFIIGLVLFLAAHLVYIAVFSKQPGSENQHKKLWLYIAIVSIVVYLLAMLYVLYPTLADLKIPVTVYALVISTMLLIAVKGTLRWKGNAKYYLLAGAVCFVLSDSLLAFDKFYKPLSMASFNIMSTYLCAQFLIVFGILVLNKKQHSVLSENAAI